MYFLDIKPELDKKLRKLRKKDVKQHEIILKKAAEIIQNPLHYKNLRAPLQHLKEVHIDTHFVLTFSVDENNKRVTLEDYVHHDKIFNSLFLKLNGRIKECSYLNGLTAFIPSIFPKPASSV